MKELKILYITRSAPTGSLETFLIPELSSLSHYDKKVYVCPILPEGDVVNEEFSEYVHDEFVSNLITIRKVCEASIGMVTDMRQWIRMLRYSFRDMKMRLIRNNLSLIPTAFHLASLVRKYKIRHIHAYWATAPATLALFVSMLSNVPWSFTAHRYDIFENNLLSLKLNRASFSRFISAHGLQALEDMGIRPRLGAETVIHLGVIIPTSVKGIGLQKVMENRVFLCPASLRPVKGHSYLLEACSQLKAEGIQFELHIAGDGPLRAQLENLGSKLVQSGHVRFLGHVHYDKILSWYRDRSVFGVILPSVDLGNGLHEGIPVSLMEAMSYGIPVISTRTGGIPELIDSDCGILVEGADSGALTGAMRTLLTDVDTYNRLGANARARVMEKFDAASNTRELIRLFGESLNETAV